MLIIAKLSCILTSFIGQEIVINRALLSWVPHKCEKTQNISYAFSRRNTNMQLLPIFKIPEWNGKSDTGNGKER